MKYRMWLTQSASSSNYHGCLEIAFIEIETWKMAMENYVYREYIIF